MFRTGSGEHSGHRAADPLIQVLSLTVAAARAMRRPVLVRIRHGRAASDKGCVLGVLPGGSALDSVRYRGWAWVPVGVLGRRGVGRLLIALDPGVQVSPGELAAAWDADEQARAVGPAAVEAPARGEFLPDVLTLVAIPLGVNLASTAITAMVGRLVTRLRNTPPDQPEIEVAELTSADGDRVVVVRLRGGRS